MTARRPHVADLERRYGRAGIRVIDLLRERKAARGGLTPEDAASVAAEVGLPRAGVHGAVSFYADLEYQPERPDAVRACAGTGCFACTGGAHLAAAEDAAAASGRTVRHVYCLGYCYAAPAALAGETPHAGADLAAQLAGTAERRDPPIPYRSVVPEPVVLAGLAGGAPAWSVWPAVVRAGAAERVRTEVAASGLRGRGGAAFPAARKWATAAARPGPRVLVCNGDEGDPGSFADRLLMESDPHRVLEGMALAALAIGAERGIAYVRSEYPRARDAMREAVGAARADGHLGPAVHGTAHAFDVEVVEGAGSYVAGEETALLRSLEGLRGGAASRPPYPAEEGLAGLPTVVNNVETLCAVPWIVAHGGAEYARLGTPESRGTKLVSLNERFARPGAYEVELGVPLRVLCEDLGGGLKDGARLRALQVGGPLGGFVGSGDLDAPLSFEGLRARGVELGHGGLVALDERVSGAEVLLHIWRFAADESCGTCAPCRIGSRRGLELAEQIAAGRATGSTRAAMDRLLDVMGTASLCGFGLGVAPAVRSLLRVYGDELGAP